MSVDDEECSGWPSTGTTIENVAKVWQAILEDGWWTIHDVCNIVRLLYETCQRIFSDELSMWHITAKFVPRLLSSDQKEYHIAVCTELKEWAENYPNFISNINTGDKSWVFGYDAETKQQSSQWKTPTSLRLKKAQQVRSNVKSTLIIFFDIQGIMLKESVPPGQTVNWKLYCDVLRWLRENIWHKCPDKWHNSWVLHHDNTAAHALLIVQQFLASMNTTVIPHHPYSQDLAPCDFFLFPKMKLKLKGRRFDSTKKIQTVSQNVMKTLTRNYFQKFFWSKKSCWNHCINAKRNYFKDAGGE